MVEGAITKLNGEGNFFFFFFFARKIINLNIIKELVNQQQQIYLYKME